MTLALDEAAQRLTRAVAALEARARALKAAKAAPPKDALGDDLFAAPQANGHDPALRQAAEEASAALADAIAQIEQMKQGAV